MRIFTKELIKTDCFFSPKIYSKPCAFGERGAYAKKEIKKGEIVAIYTGKAIDKNEYDVLSDKMKHYSFGIGDNSFLIPYSLDELDDDDFINHSCNPNVGIVGLNILVAMRTIKKNEEITLDYAMCDTQEPDMICQCGDKKCRGIITGDDWKLPELQKRYKNYFSDYILRKIDATKEDTTVDTIREEKIPSIPLQLQVMQSELN